MTAKILFVDDERSLLNGIERRLGLDYDIVTAISGEDGLTAIREQGPFALVVTDMRMPQMNGVQFVQEARKISADAVYMMLTGNQDQATATDAVNNGQVFRFLNKPCQTDDLKIAIEAGLRQFQLVAGERELLHKTFCGAVGVLTDVLESSHPEIFGRCARTSEIVSRLCKSLSFEERWEYKLATKLSLLGFVIIPDDGRTSIDFALQGNPEARKQMLQAAEIGERLVQRIPRLECVAKIIRRQAEADGSLCSSQPKNEQEVAGVGATLLRLALHWDSATRQGLTTTTAIQEIQSALPQLGVNVIDALQEIDLDVSGIEQCDVAIDDLEVGMVLADYIITPCGTILLRQGRRLNATIIEKIRCHSEIEGDAGAYKVYSSTISRETVGARA